MGLQMDEKRRKSSSNHENFKEKTPRDYGYAVVGKVVKGMDAVDTISAKKTGNKGYFSDLPEENIIIYKVFIQN